MDKDIRTEADWLFHDIMSKTCSEVTFAAGSTDMIDHVDIICDNIRYEVKGDKRMSRHHEFVRIYWIEIRNVLGNDGWVKGKANYIVFKQCNEFIIIDRQDLLEFTRAKVKDLKVYRTKGHCKLYHRSNRPKEAITYFWEEDIRHLIKKVIKINQTDYDNLQARY